MRIDKFLTKGLGSARERGGKPKDENERREGGSREAGEKRRVIMKSSAWEITELHDGRAREGDIVTNGYSMDGSIAENIETSKTRRKNSISRNQIQSV